MGSAKIAKIRCLLKKQLYSDYDYFLQVGPEADVPPDYDNDVHDRGRHRLHA